MKKTFHYVQGASGYGKTLAAKRIAIARARAGGRVLIVDPNAVFDGFGTVVNVQTAMGALQVAARDTAPFFLTVRPGWSEKLSQLWRYAFAAGRLLVVVDEAQNYAGADVLDREFLSLVEKGRNRWVDLVTTSQAPTTLHPRIRGNFDVLTTFRQAQPQYAERIASEYFRRPELAAAIMALPRLHFIRGTAEGAISRGVVPDPASSPASYRP